MNLAPISPTNGRPDFDRDPSEAAMPEAAEDFANMLAVMTCAPINVTQPPVPMPTPKATESVSNVQLDIPTTPIETVLASPFNAAPGVEPFADQIPTPAPPMQLAADPKAVTEAWPTPPDTAPDLAENIQPESIQPENIKPGSPGPTLEDADAFGRLSVTSGNSAGTLPVETASQSPVSNLIPVAAITKNDSKASAPVNDGPIDADVDNSGPIPVFGAIPFPKTTQANQPTKADSPRIETILPKVSPEEPRTGVVSTADGQQPETLVNETTQREANIVASYLAEGTRERGEMSPVGALKMQLSANNSGADSNQRETDPKQSFRSEVVSGVEFQAVRTVARQDAVGIDQLIDSPVAQTVSHILELAEKTAPRESRTVRLRLRPEELGQVDVQLSRDNSGRISAQLTVERESARSVLAHSLEQLRESLQKAGLEVDRLQVRAEVSSFSSGQGTNQRAQEESRSPYQSANLNNTNSSTETHAPQLKRVNNHKLLSLSA